MALRQWELEPDRLPHLSLASPPPSRRRPLAAAALVLVLLAGLSIPLIGPLTKEPAPLERPRALPASSLVWLDRVPPVPKSAIPRSAVPVGGMAFVRCTRLWTAWPDGSRPRRVLDIPGISSPTFSPDGRSIAFSFAGEAGSSLWVAAADGSGVRRLGTIRAQGWPVDAEVTGLSWSPNGRRLGFALRDPDYSPFEGGSSVWDLDLARGWFTKRGHGWPQPFWWRNVLAFGKTNAERGDVSLGSGTTLRMLSSGGAAVTADVTTALSWVDRPAYEAVVLERSLDGRPQLSLRRHAIGREANHSVVPPRGFAIPRHARPTLSQDGTHVSVSLLNEDGEPDLGVYDTISRRWTILPYAWQPSASPAPESFGPPGEARALGVAETLLSNWGQSGTTTSLLSSEKGHARAPRYDDVRFAYRPPIHRGDAWIVPGTVYGERGGAFSSHRVSVRVWSEDGRLVGRVQDVSPASRIATVEDAIAFLRATLTVPVLDPVGLPRGTVLKATRHVWPVSAGTYDGRTTGSLALKLPDGGDLTIDYGGAYFHSCGEYVGRPVSVDGQPALLGGDGSSGFHQVLWPATEASLGQEGAAFSIYGQLSREETLALAAEMNP